MVEESEVETLRALIHRAKEIMPSYYTGWHEKAATVLRIEPPDLDRPPTPRRAIQIAQAFDSQSMQDVTAALCNDGTIMLIWSGAKGWKILPPIPQDGES